MLKRLSISSQLRWGILLLVMVCMFASGSLLLYLSYQQQLQHASQLQQAQAAAAARHIGLYAFDLITKLKYLAKVDGLMSFPAETQYRLLSALQQYNEAYDSVALFNAQGEPVLQLGIVDPLLHRPLMSETPLSQLLQQNQHNSLFTNTQIASDTGQLISYFAVLVQNTNQDIKGLLIARLNFRFLNFLVSQLHVGQTGYIYVADQQGLLIASQEWNMDQQIMQLEDLSLRDYWSALSEQTASSELLQYQGLKGLPVVGAVAAVPLTGWQVVTELPRREIQLALYTLLISMLLSLVVALIFATLLSLRFSHKIIRPLKTLTQTAMYIREGNLNVRARIKANHEIGVLAYTFNQMVEQLQTLFQQLQENLERANSANRAKSTFLANMSHELRTPLNGILGYAQVLMRDRQLTEEQRNGVEVILHSGRYLLTLISDILDLSRIEAGRLELIEQDFNLPELLNNLVILFKTRAQEKGLAFNYEPLTTLPMALHGDERRLRQVLSNLLSNAVKFTQQGGITFRASADNYRLNFQVIDTGIGISETDIARIFQPFQQLSDINNKSAGTGLGLSISHSLVSMMGGELQLESQLGYGSHFNFFVQMHEALEASVLKTPLPNTVITGFKGEPQIILVVDDHWQNRVIVRDLLTPLGFKVIEASNGQEALRLAEQVQPACVITDLVMPVMDGFELMRLLRKHPTLATVPIIAASASVLDAPENNTAIGCDNFINKPFHADTLLQLLQLHLALDWEYDQPPLHTPADSPIVKTPSPAESELEYVQLSTETADQIYEAAMMGDISGILQQIEALEQGDPRYQAFAHKIRSLAQAFDEEAICQLVSKYRPSA